MAIPNGGGGSQDAARQRRTGWWGWNRDYGWDDQGCLGCGLAWWIVVLCAFLVFGFWGWGVPGWGGWGGWGWRHSAGNWNNCPPGQTGTTNMQPGGGAQQGGGAQPGIAPADGGAAGPSGGQNVSPAAK